MTQEINKLRFGIMCDGPVLQAWQRNCLEDLVSAGIAEPVCLIVGKKPVTAEPKATGTRSPIARLFHKIRRLADRETRRTALWTLYMRRYHSHGKATMDVDCQDILGGLDRIECAITRQGKYSEVFDAGSVAGIRDLGLDFIVKFAFGIIRGDILDTARYGVWSYHHADERLIRGSPACFWEIYHGLSTTGGMLQRLTPALDAGIVLHRGTFKTNSSYIKQRDQVLFASADWCARACRDILHGNLGFVEAAPSNSQAPIHRAPGNLQMMYFALLKVKNVLAGQYKKHFTYDIWNVGVLDKSPRDVLAGGTLSGVTWAATHDKYSFIADPFSLSDGGKTTILVEEFDYRTTAKGRLKKLSFPGAATRLALEEVEMSDVHLSYPCLFAHQGEEYCVPETHEARLITLYRRTGANDFSFERVLVENVAASDPTVFKYDGLWWLFFTDEARGSSLKLNAYYAKELAGDWMAHPLNPLKCDITSARPAGAPFVLDGNLYRPTQDCSVSYGGAISICHIMELTPTAFDEQVVAEVKPDPSGPYPDGTHTLNCMTDRCLVDGKKVVFDPAWIFRRRRYEELARARREVI